MRVTSEFLTNDLLEHWRVEQMMRNYAHLTDVLRIEICDTYLMIFSVLSISINKVKVFVCLLYRNNSYSYVLNACGSTNNKIAIMIICLFVPVILQNGCTGFYFQWQIGHRQHQQAVSETPFKIRSTVSEVLRNKQTEKKFKISGLFLLVLHNNILLYAFVKKMLF